MKEFTFDLQRFADVCSLNGTAYDSFATAYAAAQDGDEIILLQDASGDGFEIAKNITFDLNGFTYTVDNGSSSGLGTASFTSTAGANYTFKNGNLIITRRINICITNSGTLTLEDINIISDNNRSAVSSTATATTYIKGTSTVVAKSVKNGTGVKYNLDNGVVITSSTTSATASPIIRTAADNSATVTVLNNNNSFKAVENAKEVTYTATSENGLSVAYNPSGTPSIQNVTSGLSFSTAINSSSGTKTVTYTVTDSGLQAVSDGKTKILEGVTLDPNTPVPMATLDFDTSENLTAAIFATKDVLSITASDLSLMNDNDTLKIVDAADYSKSYGYLTKLNDYTFELTKDSNNKRSLTGINIDGTLTARVAADFKDTAITVTRNKLSTTLQSESNNPFTLTADTNSLVSVEGAVSVSLVGGSIKTANSQTTVKAGTNKNTVYYTASTGDGINVIANSSSGATISGIDEGETFNVGGNDYRREGVGLRTGNSNVFTSNVASVSANDNSLYIDLASLRGAVGSFIQPNNGSLEIGLNTGNAVVVNNTSSPSIKYAELFADSSSTLGNAYTLTSASDGNVEQFLNAVDTISVTGGIGTTIYKQLANDVTIATGAGSVADATFKVTNVTGNTFVVNLKTSSAETKISNNAKGITLLSGTITAAAGQTITLGEGENARQFYVTSSAAGMNVTFNNGTATITGAAEDTFTVDGQSFTVDSKSDGMTFTLTGDKTNGTVKANNFSSANADAFTYNGANYSVRGAGFVMEQSGSYSIWSALQDGERTGNHSLTGGSVTIESLPADDTHIWDPLSNKVTVSNSIASANLPPFDINATVTLASTDFSKTYGIFSKNGTGCTLVAGSGNNEGKINQITFGSGVDNVQLGDTLNSLTDITINSAVASFIVTQDDGDAGYQLTLTSSASDEKLPAQVGGARRASLISGSLQSDSYFTATVLDNRIIATGDVSVTVIADGSDASITGLAQGEGFSIEGTGAFTMSEVGLVDDSSRYLLGTKEGNPIILSELNGDTPWGGLIAAANDFTITSGTTTALIVDNTSAPDALYADYTNINGVQSLRAANSATAWNNDITIHVSDTTVNFSNYFEDKKIKGDRSGATFTVEDGVAFSVYDTRTGAVIGGGNATNISQTGGIISVTSGQAVHSAAGSVKAGTGDFTFTVNENAATIGALGNSDVFSLEAGGSNVEYTKNRLGIVTGDNRILTGLAVNESVTVADLLGDNWTNTVQIRNNILAVPPTVSGSASPWIILSSNKQNAYGTLETVSGGGYSIHKSENAISGRESDWAEGNTVSISAQPVTFSKDFSGALIAGLRSEASIAVVSATGDFKFTDGAGGATVDGAGSNTVNQFAGVVVPQLNQKIIAGNETITATSNSGDIKVNVTDGAATITELSQGDTFTINNYTFEVLEGGVIRRNGSELRQASASETAANLIDNWNGRLEIAATQNLTLTAALLGKMTANTCYIVDEANNNRVYGTIERSTTSPVVYSISTVGANVTPFDSVTVATNVEHVTFAKDHYITNGIPITAGNATFTVTDRDVDSFTVNYDGTASVDTATTLNLTSGTLKLTNSGQIVTAGSTTAAVNSGTITVNYDGSKLTVGSMDTAGDSVKINGTYDYTYNSGNGMTIEVAADGTTTFKNLDDDSFTMPDGTTYKKTSTGFVKTSGNLKYMWTNADLDVSSGVNIGQLNTDGNWTQIQVLTNGELTINSASSATVVLVGNEDDPSSTIYGKLTVSGSTRTLSADGGANASLSKITVDGVAVTVTEDFSTVPIVLKGNNPAISTTTPMTFQPEDNGMTFKVIMNGEETEYTLTSSGSSYILSRGSEGNTLTLTQSDNKYTLPGGRWVTSGGTFRIDNGESVTLEYSTSDTVTTSTVSCDGGDYITAKGADGQWQEFSSLTAGDKFTITTTSNSTSYEVLSDGKTLGKYDTNGNIAQFYVNEISNATLTYDQVTSNDYKNVTTLTDGVLDLSAQPATSPYTVSVYGTTTDGTIDPTKDIATVNYTAAGGYTLGNAGKAIGDLESIRLGTVKNLTTTIYNPVTTAANDTSTYTVNGAEFAADNSALTLTPNSSGATLTAGKVKLTAGKAVLTANGTITADSANTAALTVEAGTDITVGGLANGLAFDLDGTKYTMSAIGLSYYTGSGEEKLYGITDAAITVSKLLEGGETILDATGGILTVDNTGTPELAAVIDKNNGIRYGTLTKSTTGFTFEPNETATASLNNINLNGVAAVLPQSTAAQITAASSSGTVAAVFTVTASDTFTVDATKTVPEFSDTVTAINLSSGTVSANVNVPITVGGRTITASSDSSDQMTVKYDGTNTVIGGLNIGDTFKIGNIEYEVTSTNELYNKSNGQIVTGNSFNPTAKTYTVDDTVSYDNLLTLTNGVLNLTGTFADSYTARIVSTTDGIADPTKKIATLTYSATNNTFAVRDAGTYYDELQSISLPANDAVLTTAINTTVNTARGSKTYSINGNTFKASSSALAVETAGTNTATLTNGTVSLSNGDTVTPTDDKAIAATAGNGLTVNVNGSTITIGALNDNDAFTYGGETYTKTRLGLRYDSKLIEDIGSTVTTSQLGDGTTILEAPSGVLTVDPDTIPAGTAEWTVVDTTASPAVKYGKLTFANSVYTFAQDGSALNSVVLVGSVTASLPASVADKSITAGGAEFSVKASGNFTVNSATPPVITDATSITLTSGTINAPSNIPVTAGDYTIAASGGDGLTVTAGDTVSVGALNDGDQFTVNGKSYLYNSLGLFNTSDSKRVYNLSNGTLPLPAREIQILAPSSGTLDLTSVTAAAEVYDSTSSPATKYADIKTSSSGLTLDGNNSAEANISAVNIAKGSNWTIDFATNVKTTSGTVNGQLYTSTGGNLTIRSDGSKSTLTNGTVTLTNTDVPTAQGTVAATTGTVTVNVSGDTVTVDAIGAGDQFTFGAGSDTTSYTKVSFGLVSGGKLLSLADNTPITTSDLNTNDSAWQNMIAASGGNLALTAAENAGVVVDSITAPAVNYGTLAKSGNTFTLTPNTALNSVTLTDVVANLPALLAGKTITANGNVFSVTATEEFTVDADDSIPVVDNVSAIRLTSGTVAADKLNIPVTVTSAGVTVTATGDSEDQMTVGLVGGSAQVGGLNVGDTFTVSSTGTARYQVTASGLQDLTNGTVIPDGDVYSAANKTFTISDSGGAYELIAPNSRGALVLTTIPADGYRARVVTDTTNPNTKIGTLTYSTADGFTLSDAGDDEYVAALKSISLSNADNTLTTTIDTDVTTARGSATYKINGNTFKASGSALTVEAAESTKATLKSGTVTLANGAANANVVTPAGTIAASDGTLTVAVGDTVTISGINSGESFTFGGKTYTRTDIGLSDGSNLIAGSVTSITTDELGGGSAMLAAVDGVLTISNFTGTSWIVVDSLTAPTVNYGTLTAGDGGFTFTQNGDNKLNGINIDSNLTATLTTDAPVTAGSATFTAVGTFTVNASAPPAISDATSIALTNGTINAPSSVPVTAGDYTIAASGGDGLTVKVDGSNVSVGALNSGDQFTVNGKSYLYNSLGLFNASDSKRVYNVSNGTLPLPAREIQILAPSSGTLDLTSVTAAAEVYDSTSSPATKYADIKTSSNGLTLSGTNAASANISAVNVARDSNWTVDFETDISTVSGTVNGQSYTSTSGNLTIHSDGSKSTLTNGTVTLTDTDVPTAKGTVAATNGTITVNVNGDTVTVGGIDSGESFTFGGKTYTRTNIGLSDGSNLIAGSVASITTDDLSSGSVMIPATDGVLTLTNSTTAGIIVDSTDVPTINYGTLDKDGSDFTLTPNTALNGVNISNGLTATLTTNAPVTAGNATFTAGGTFKVDTTASTPAITDASSINLTSGTVNAVESISITAGDYTIAATDGDGMTVTRDGSNVSVGSLNDGDQFTVGNKSYIMTDIGLFNATDKTRVTNISDGTLTLPAAETQILAPINGTLNLTNVTAPAEVYNSTSDPTAKLGDVTASADGFKLAGTNAASAITAVTIARDSNWTVDFETDIQTVSGTVNGQSYTSTSGTLTIHSDGSKSTLTNGTVTLTDTDVPTAKGTVAAVNGTINVNVNGDTVTVRNIGAGEQFTFGGKTYTRTNIGLSDGSNLIAGSVASITTDDLSSGSVMIPATGGVLTLTNSTTAGIVVDSTDTPTINYGTLAKDGTAFTFEAGDTALNGITVNNGLSATLTTNAPVTAGSATFTAGGSFTVTATTPPSIASATGINLTSGTVNAPSNVSITAGDYTIERTSGDGLTVTRNGDTVSVGGLNDGDQFTLDGKSYKMTAAGLFNTTNTTRVTGVSGGSWNLSDTAEVEIIAPTDGTLNLSTRTTPAEVYDSTSNPTTKLGDVTVADGLKLAGNNSAAANITTVTIARDSDWTVTFDTDVTTVSGTVNNQSYASTGGNLTIHSDGSKSALKNGTVTLTNDTDYADVPTAKGTVAAVNGTITVNASGDTVTVGNINSGDSFTLGTKSYTATAVGLKDENKLRTLTNNAINTDDLSSGWLTMIDASGGNLIVDSSTTAGIAVDSIETPTVIYANITKPSNSVRAIEEVTPLNGVTLNGVTAQLTTEAPITAGDATFTADGDLTVTATAVPTVNGATDITVTAGMINAPANVPVKVGTHTLTATGGDGMTFGISDNKVTVSALNAGDTFNVDGTTDYEVNSAGELYDVTNGTIVMEGFNVDTFTVDEFEIGKIIPLDADNNLDIKQRPNAAYTAFVTGRDDNSKRIVKLTYDGTGFIISERGADFSDLNHVLLSEVTALDATDVPLTVETSSGGTYSVNDKEFTARTALLIETAADSATLTDGTVALAVGKDVTTPKGSIASAAGTVTVNVTGSEVTVGDLSAGRAFTVDDSATYSMTSIGLSDGSRILKTDSDVTLDELNDNDSWLDILAITNGALTVDTATVSSDVVDISNPASVVEYGTLTKAGNNYTYEQTGVNALKSITLDGVTAAFPQSCAAAVFSAGDSTFSVTASGDFTVDASGSVPAITDVTAITLTAGTVKPELTIPVKVGTRTITATAGDGVTVGLVGGKVQVGSLNSGDTFTVNDTDYRVTDEGDLFDEDSAMIVTSGFSGDTFIVDDAALTRIITADGSNLDLTNQTQSALVYDSVTNPTTHLATLNVTGSNYTLTETDDNIIKTVDIKSGTDLTIDFNATVSGSGSVTVNDADYRGKGELVICADDSSSKLYSGVITLTPAVDAPAAVNDPSAIAAVNGSVDVTAANGYYTTLSGLDAGDSFNYNGITYTQSKFGLLMDDNICEKLAGSTLTLSALEDASWSQFLAPTNAALDLTGATSNAVVYDDLTNPTKKVADLTIINGRFNLKGSSGAAKAVETVRISDGDNLTVDFNTQVATGSGTVNGITYNGTSDLIIDAKSKTSSLYSGTVTLTAGNSLKATNDSSALTVTAGTVNATAALGNFVSLDDVNAGDAFTFGGKSYTQTSLGLLTGNTIAQELTGSSVDLTLLDDADWLTFLAPRNGILDISNVTSSKIVFDSVSNPVNKLADLTVDGSNYTLAGTRYADAIASVKLAKDSTLTIDFAAQVEAPSGSLTVNGKDYVATTSVTLDATDGNSTLTRGTVALDLDDSVTATLGNVITATAGDGLTVTANANSVSVGNLGAGDAFTLDDVDYSLRAIGLISDGLIYQHSANVLASGSVSVDALQSDDWINAVVIDGSLSLPNDLGSGFLVDDAFDNLYGRLAKDGNSYTLTAPANVNADLTAITLNNVAATLDDVFADVPIRANASRFADIALPDGASSFSLDAFATPTFDNVKAFTLLEGSVAAKDGQTVSADEHEISGDVLITLADDGVTVSDFDADFYVDGKIFHNAPVGLINLTDLAVVTGGLSGGTLTVDDIELTPFIGVSDGTLDLTNATENVLIYDSATNPDKQIASLTVNGNRFTLNGTDDASAIQTVNVAADSVLTVDFAAQVTAPSGSVTVNGKTYDATTAVTLQSDGTTSTLSLGTVALANGDSVNTTSGNAIAATSGDGLTVKAATDSVTVSGLNSGDTFTVDGKPYTVGALSLINDGKLWTGNDYGDGVTISALADDANWTKMLSATYASFAVDAGTLEDGEKIILVDDTTNPTTTYGTLTKTDGIYLLMKDDDADAKLAAISVQGTIIDIDTELADVPITTINADDSQSVFTVKPSAGVETFRVDATGNSPKIYGVDEIDLIDGKVFPQDGQIIKPADGSETVTLSYGNGTYTIGDKTITIGGLADGETVDIEINSDGNIDSVYGIPKDACVIYDDVTYTAPFDDARLSFEEDPCYFDGYTLPEYNVTIDPEGNIKVDTGIQFGKVVESGKTLGEDGTIQIAGDGAAVKITNESEIPLKVTDADGDTLAENLNADEGVTFSDDGVAVDDLTAVAGATINLDEGQSLTADGEATIAAQGENGATVGVGTDGDNISVDGSAQIDAPEGTELTLGDAPYTVKGADFESSGTAQATVTGDGVKLDLGLSDAITHDDMTLTGGESSTAELNGDGGITLTSGTIAENADDKAITVDGEVVLDDKTVNAAEAVEVTAKADGLNVGNTELTIGGDSSGYQVNIEGGAITGLENIGDGATIGGLSDATVKTNEEGSITVGDKTFTTTGDSAVTYGLAGGSIASISDLNGILAGDFSYGLTVNGDPLTVNSSLPGAVAIAADEDGVTAVQTGDADSYTINGHVFETSGDALFGMSSGRVTGVTTDDGIFAIGQDESDFKLNDESLTLSRNSAPVTLSISNGGISGVCGVDGAISGLSDATVCDLTRATVNGKALDVSGSDFDAIVVDGETASIVGLSAPAQVNSAPSMAIVTSGDGSFTVGGQGYSIDDTVDNSVTFTTDANSRLTGINNFAGSLNGAVTSLTVNGKEFGTNNGSVTVSSDGTNITKIDGLKNGDSIGGDIDNASFYMPQGRLTINGGVYTLEDDEDGAQASRGGKVFTSVAKDASLTVGSEGSHRVNGGGGRASVGSVFTVNRDGGYLINPDYLPIIEKTPANEIRGRSAGTLAMQEGNGTVGAGNDTVVVRRDAQVTVEASGEPLIIATSGAVTLDNYNGGAASIGSFEYTNIANAIKTNAIQFGDGVMTLGDAVITFDANAGSTGSTMADLVNAQGREQAIGFTHTNGGTVNASGSTEAYVLKGNYANSVSDTQKSGGSSVIGGSGNDTLLVGGGDTVNGGAGDDDIYVTDGAFRELGALIVMSAGADKVHNFNGGYGAASDTVVISDLNALEYQTRTGLVLTSGDRQMAFDGMTSSADLVTSSDMAESADTASSKDGSYRLKLRDGNSDYNAAIARAGRNIIVADGDLANVFFGEGSGVNFSEYTGAIAVNLDAGTGNVGNTRAQFKGIDKLTGGAGASTLTGAADASNTLTSGIGGGQIWSNSGNDLMVGQSGKTGATTFQYLANDGQDTISNFEFATSADAAGDLIDITTANAVTTVSLSGGNVILYINGSETDYLTLARGKGEDFRINNLVAQVDERSLEFDGVANCYVADGGNATLKVDATMAAAEVWLNDKGNGLHGAYYLGDITVVDGSKSAGQLILTGNDLNNTVIGGAGVNSIWGGYGYDSDVMIGGTGQNTFFFALVNGNDVIEGAHDGDVIDLTTVKTSEITGTSITEGGTAIGLWDGSILEVKSNAAVEYKTADGSYMADHATGQWVKTK